MNFKKSFVTGTILLRVGKAALFLCICITMVTGCSDFSSDIPKCPEKPLDSTEEDVLREIIRLNGLDSNIHRIARTVDNVDGCDLGYVEAIHIRNMGIDTIPPSIAKLEKSEGFYLDGNNLKTLPVEMVEKFKTTACIQISNNKICEPYPALTAWADRCHTVAPSWQSTQTCTTQTRN